MSAVVVVRFMAWRVLRRGGASIAGPSWSIRRGSVRLGGFGVLRVVRA